MAHALVTEGFDVIAREGLDESFEQLGHEMRAAIDDQYKRETWGLRPEDIAEVQALTGEAKRWSAT